MAEMIGITKRGTYTIKNTSSPTFTIYTQKEYKENKILPSPSKTKYALNLCARSLHVVLNLILTTIQDLNVYFHWYCRLLITFLKNSYVEFLAAKGD